MPSITEVIGIRCRMRSAFPADRRAVMDERGRGAGGIRKGFRVAASEKNSRSPTYLHIIIELFYSLK